MRAILIVLLSSTLGARVVHASLTLISHNATGPSYAVTYANGTCYAGLGGRLHVLTPDLELISQVDLPSVIDGIDVQGTTAYVSTWFAGMCVVDLATLGGPQLIGMLQLPGQGRGIFVEGSIAYVASSESGLRIVDVSQPTNPVEIGFYDTPLSALGVLVEGDHAYVADRTGGVLVLDVSTPSAPQFLSTFTLGGSYRAQDVDIDGNNLFVAYEGTGLRILDVSAPDSPVHIGSLAMLEDVIGVAVVGNVAYLSRFGGGIAIADVSNPSAPSLIGSMVTDGRSYEAVVAGDQLFLADGDEAVRLIDIGTPSSPTEISRLDPVGRAAEVGISGSNIVVANFGKSTNGFRVLDAANPSSVEEIGRFVTPGTTHDVAVKNGYVYLGEGWPNYGLTIAGIQDPQNPALISHLGLGNPPNGLDVADDKAYLTFDDRMRIVNVQDPDGPSVVGTFVVGLPTTYLADVTVAGTMAYVVDFDRGLRIVNVSNPANPYQLGTYQIPGTVYDVAVAGGIAYLATSDALRVIDVSTPSNPTHISTLPLPSQCFGVLLNGSTAYVCAGPAGVFAVEITNPSTPVVSGHYDTGDRAGTACLYYDYVVVADVSNGIYVLADDTVVSTPSITSVVPGIHAYPNPFNPSTTVSFSMPTSGVVSLQVFNVRGTLVRTLASGRYEAGVHTVSWDGSDGAGDPSASGVYFCRLRAGNETVNHKLVLLK